MGYCEVDSNQVVERLFDQRKKNLTKKQSGGLFFSPLKAALLPAIKSTFPHQKKGLAAASPFFNEAFSRGT